MPRHKEENQFGRMVRMVRFYYPGTWERDTEIAQWFEKAPSSVTRWRSGDNDHWKNHLLKIKDEFPIAYEAYTTSAEQACMSVNQFIEENKRLTEKVEQLTEQVDKLRDENQLLTKTVITGMDLVRQARREVEELKKML